MSELRPLIPRKRPYSGHRWMSQTCRLCCKSLKTPGDKFPARSRNKPRSLIDVASGLLPKSPVSLSPGDEVPHMFTRKPRLQLEKFAINGAKRLLQHNLPRADSRTATSDARVAFVGASSHRTVTCDDPRTNPRPRTSGFRSAARARRAPARRCWSTSACG